MDELVERGMTRDDKFGIMRRMVLNGTSDEDLIKHYYTYPFSSGGALGVLFMHSIAFPAIMHYKKELGSENVMVVTDEELNVKNMTRVRNTLSRIFAFAGLCPFDIPDMDKALQGKNEIPTDKEMSQDVYTRLTKFFAPFNDALMRTTGFNLSHWNTKKPSSKLPKYFNVNRPRTAIEGGINEGALPKAWFEIEDDERLNKKEKRGLFKSLLPHRISEGDSGFNTTTGLLTMF